MCGGPLYRRYIQTQVCTADPREQHCRMKLLVLRKAKAHSAASYYTHQTRTGGSNLPAQEKLRLEHRVGKQPIGHEYSMGVNHQQTPPFFGRPLPILADPSV